MVLMYSLVLVGAFSILTNALIIHVVRVNAHMHTSTNFLIVNMACGDLLATIITVPFASYSLAKYEDGTNWVSDLEPPTRIILCRMKRYLFFASLFCSIFSLVGITFERFLAVVRPLAHTQGNRWNKLVIPLVWFVSLTLPLHQLISVELVVPRAKGSPYVCEALRAMTDAYVFVFLGYIIPHVTMIVLYVAIAIALYKRRVPGERHSSNGQPSASKQIANKVTRMIICILLAFNFCYAPLFLLYISPFLPEARLSNMQNKMASKVLMAFNGTSNALIYAIFNEKFRRAFKAALYNESLASAFRMVSRSRSSTRLSSSINVEKSPVKAAETMKA